MSLCIHVIWLLTIIIPYRSRVEDAQLLGCMHGFLVTGEAQSIFLIREGAQGDVDRY